VQRFYKEQMYAWNLCRMKEVIVMNFDISRLCTRVVLILLLIDSMECRSEYNESLISFFTQ